MLHKRPYKDHHVDACLKTLTQLGQGQHMVISQENQNDQSPGLISLPQICTLDTKAQIQSQT